MSTTTRNPGLLPPAIAAAIAPPPSGPDAELIRLCRQFEAAENQIRALYDGPGEVDEDKASAALSVIEREQISPLLGWMGNISAKTSEAIHARARAMAAHNADFGLSFEEEGTVANRLLTYLMRDAMALGGSSHEPR